MVLPDIPAFSASLMSGPRNGVAFFWNRKFVSAWCLLNLPISGHLPLAYPGLVVTDLDVYQVLRERELTTERMPGEIEALRSVVP